MASNIEPRPSFLHQKNGHGEKQSSNPTNETDEKASAVAHETLSNATWYTELPPAPNGKPSIINRLPPNMVNVISAALETPQTKQKPTPPPRSSTTCLSPSIQRKASETDGQKKAFTSDLSAVINARSALNPLEKKTLPTPFPRSNAIHLSSISGRSNTENPVKNTPPLPLSKENKSKIEPIFAPIPTVPTLIPKRKISFQREAMIKDSETSSSEVSNTLPIKGILKKIPLSNSAEEPIEPKKKEISPEMRELNKILKELEEYSNS